MLATTAPLLQRWLTLTRHAGAADPYPLYAASNAGSIVGLLAYPFLFEPNLRLTTPDLSMSQSVVWSCGYLVFAVAVATAGAAMLRRRVVDPDADATGRAESRSKHVPVSTRLRWVLLAAVPSSAMLGTTQLLTTDIAAIPLLWVLPLGVYLVTFILAFSRAAWPRKRWSSVALAVLATCVVATFWAFTKPWAWLLIPLHLLTLFAVGMVGHGRLAAGRPATDRLTEFYLLIGLGGVLGGAFNALAAPVLFRSVLEYPLILLVACLLRQPLGSPVSPSRSRREAMLDVLLPVALALVILGLEHVIPWAGIGDDVMVVILQVGIPCVLCLLLMKHPLRFALGLAVIFVLAWRQTQAATPVLHSERTFFGVYNVRRIEGRRVFLAGTGEDSKIDRVSFNVLYHGTTRHGSQAVDPRLLRRATSYYHVTGPIGQLFAAFGGDSRLDRIGVVGLGVGTLATYGRTGQSFTFYEIDKAVVRIARDTSFFTYLRDTPARIECEIGDGRLTIARAPDGGYGLIVLDAFSSDAVPVHLLTREALQLYLRKLRPDGMVAIHLTNQYVELEPVIDALTRDLGLAGLVQWDTIGSPEALMEGKDVSTWAILARDRSSLGALADDPRWAKLPLEIAGPADARFLWTDDYSNLWSVLK
jgi:hypothetical protein